MGQNIKREIIDNIVVAMSIYISDQDTIAILDSVISSELTKVNLQEICSLPAEWKTDTEQRNAYLIMRDACKNIRERAIIEVFRSTGARVGEISEIRTEQVNLETGDILIEGEKGGRYRTLYLDDDARYYYGMYLESRTDNSPFMFPQSRKPYGQMSVCGFRTIIKNVGARADVKSAVYPHKMRKTLGMNLKNRKVDIGIIQEILGHASPAVTSMYYAQSTPKTLRDVREMVQI